MLFTLLCVYGIDVVARCDDGTLPGLLLRCDPLCRRCDNVLVTLCTAPVLVALLAAVLLCERLKLRILLSGGCALAGTTLLVGIQSGSVSVQGSTYLCDNQFLPKNPGSMKRNSSGRNQANSDVHQQLHKLPYLEYPDLLTATNIVGGKTTCLIKGAITARLSLARLRDEIRYRVDRGTFPDRIERLTRFLEGCTPTTTEQVVNEKNPKVVVRELIDTTQAIACELPDRVLFDLVLSLIENPEGVFDGDYNTFDSAAEKLGFSYEETDEDYNSRIVPSPQLLKQIVTQMTRGEFYHSFIYLAGFGLDRNQFSPPPSQFLAGYEFLEQLAEFLSSLSVQQPWNGSHIHHKALDSANRF